MKSIILAILCCAVLATSARADGLAGMFSYWETDDLGASEGYGIKLVGTEDPAGYLEFRFSRFSGFESDEGSPAIEAEVTPIEVGMTYNLSNRDDFMIYLGGGGGYYMMEATVDVGAGGRDADIDNEWGWYGLAGVEIRLASSLHLFAEGMYRSVDAAVPAGGVDGLEEKLNLEFDGLGGNAGLLWIF
jgi:hypothetical protein